MSHRELTVADSLTNLLGKNAKIFFKTLVRLEIRGDKHKTENRLLVFCSSRLFILTIKVPARVEAHYHYLEIEALESRQANHICFVFEGDTRPLSVLIGEDAEGNARVIGAICALAGVLARLCPGAALGHIIPKISIPGAMEAAERGLGSASIAGGPCGGFSAQYAASCDFLQVPFREDVAWDIDTMYHTHNQRILMLRDFEHLDPKEINALICALQYNRWFKGIWGSGDGSIGALGILCGALKRGALRELRWPKGGLRPDAIAKICPAISTAASLHTVDFTDNPIEDKGAINLINALSSNENGLRHICLAHCNITGKAANSLGVMLCDNINNLETLSHLDLSNNNLKDDIHDLCNFLAQPNVLTYLNLSNTEITLENIFGALLRGCGAKLRWLSLANNPWSNRRGTRDPPPSLRQFFTACLALDYLDFSHCRLPQDVLKNILLGLACNETTTGLKLFLRGSLASGGPLVLDSCLHGVRCLTHLDLSDNCWEGELAGVMTAAGKSRSLKGLVIARLQGRRQLAGPVVQALVEIFQDPDSVLQTLDISDCKLKGTLLPLLGALGATRSMQSLDITGNGVGDPGARLLARALRLNTSLRHLSIDRNHLTYKGITELSQAMQYNRSLQKIGFPASDVIAAGKNGLERIEPLWKQIEEQLLRNASADVFSSNELDDDSLPRCALPPNPLPRLLEISTDIVHQGIINHLKSCADAAVDQAGNTRGASASILRRTEPPRTAIQKALARAMHPLSSQLTEACNAIIRNVFENGEVDELMDGGSDLDVPRRLRPAPLPPPPLPAHSTATPLGGRRVSEAGSCASGERPQSAAGVPPGRHSPDSLADLPSNHCQLSHLVKGRPRRAKTRAPSRPVPETHSHRTADGVEVFWRGRSSPSSPRSTHSSPTSPTSHSITLQNDDTMYSITSGESTPVAHDEKSETDGGSRARSTENPSPTTPGTGNSTTAPSTTPLTEDESPITNHKDAPIETAPCITDVFADGVEDCVGGSIIGISPAALTGSMRKEAPLAVEEAS